MKKTAQAIADKVASEPSKMTSNTENAYYGWLWSQDRVKQLSEQCDEAKNEVICAQAYLKDVTEALNEATKFEHQMHGRFQQTENADKN